MFSNPTKIDYSLDEGTVTEVDATRKFCKVKTMSGQNLDAVKWLYSSGGSSRGGDRSTPRLGDAVVIHNGLGYPLIIGYLPRIAGGDNIFSSPIDVGEQLVDTGNFSYGSNDVRPDQNAPKDMVSGDRIIGSEGGGFIALLRAGSVLLRSSRLAEIFVCKWDDLVRVVSRNWEHFTDLSSDTIKHIGGRLYRYTGYANNVGEGLSENYKFNQYWGDVSLGEKGKADYINIQDGAGPAQDDRIYKEEIVTGSGASDTLRYTREIHLTGEHFVRVQNDGNTLFSQMDVTNTTADIKTSSGDGSTFTHFQQTKDQTIVSYNDTNIITINKDEILLNFSGDPTILMDANGVHAKFGSATMNLLGSTATINFGGTTFVLDGSTITGTTSTVNFNAPTINLNGEVNASSNVNVAGGLGVSGASSMGGGASVSGTIDVSGTINASGHIHGSNIS